MRYKQFGKTGESVSVLGFGCLTPLLLSGSKRVDTRQALALIRHAVDNGVNYLDATYPYQSAGSVAEAVESLAAKALKSGKGQNVLLAAQLPGWRTASRKDMDAHLDRQLNRLGTGSIDCYSVGHIQRADWKILKENGLAGFLDAARAAGKIRHAGFSACDTPELFREILEYYDWSFCQQAYNYYGAAFQAGRAGIALAAAKGLGVAAMDPLLGGALADGLPTDVKRALGEADSGKSPAALALAWAWNDPNVSLVLCGMRSMRELEENCRLADLAGPGFLADTERDALRRARSALKSAHPIPCTECHQCACPAGVEIPAVFAAYNAAHLFPEPPLSHAYGQLSPDKRASQCTGCGMCEMLCPEQIRIRIQVARAADYFGDKR